MSNNARSVTPNQGGHGRKSPFRMPPRSATAPLPYRAPSPELPLPQDCAFPVFPTTKSRSTTPTTPSALKLENAPLRPQADAHGIMAPISARNNVGGFLQRMNSITPGPFTASRSSTSIHNLGHGRTVTRGNLEDESQPPSASYTRTHSQRPSIAGSGHVKKSSFSSIFAGTRNPPLGEKSDGSPTICESPLPQTLLSDARYVPPPLPHNTTKYLPSDYPRQGTNTHDLWIQDRNSGSGSAPERAISSTSSELSKLNHKRQASVAAANRPLYEIGSTSTYKPHRTPPSRSASPITVDTRFSRSASRTRDRTDPRLNNAPPVPVPSRPEDFQIGNPHHTPTESVSSVGTSRSDVHSGSSRSSPPLSENSYLSGSRFLDEQSPPNIVEFDFQPTVARPAEQQEALPIKTCPTKSFSRPTHVRPVSENAQPEPENEPPESPTDPAIQSSRFATVPTVVDKQSSSRPAQGERSWSSQSQRSQTRTKREENLVFQVHPLQHLVATTKPLRATPASPARDTIPIRDTDNHAPALPCVRDQGTSSPVGRPTTTNKGNCRGCGELIQGKSVSSADGRLTGRYHKQCFVCKTCKKPFQTTDFYVIDNHPYCQRHYHVLNGSLCGSCDRGIEGQYLETEVKQKFHPHCFTCQVRVSSQ